jgi:predicted amidohydrolase
MSDARAPREVVEVVALQLEARPGQVERNLDRLAGAVRRRCAGADLIVTPELVSTGYDLAEIDRRGAELAEGLEGPTLTLTASLAAEVGAVIVVGLLEAEGGRLYDTAVVVSPDGTAVPYRKSHLYPPERGLFSAGDRLLSVPTAIGRLGVMICFEHAFPEIATALALEGARIIAIPSAVPVGYEHLLRLRTRARAQDNQLFAVACNATGGRFCGGSLIVDPRGEVMAEAGSGEAALRATLDMGAIARERAREPALRLRRPTLYRGPARRPRERA